MKRTIIATTAMFVVLTAAVLLLFWQPLKTAVVEAFEPDPTTEEQTEEPTEEPTETPTDALRAHVFFTYSLYKLGNYNFFEDCYSKAQLAVEEGRASSIEEYILDEEFDHDALTKAEAAVEAGEVESVLDYMRQHEDSGKIAFLLYYDPMFAASWGCYIDQQGITGDDPILAEEQDLPVEQRPDAAITRYLEDTAAWDAAIERITEILWNEENTRELKELDDYISSMYAISDEDGIPSVVVRETENAGGHFIVIGYKMADGSVIELKFRLECGYQPVDIPNWTPSGPPVEDNPPTPDELESKDPANDAWNNDEASNQPWWESDPTSERTTQTDVTPDPMPEETSPDEYVAPDPPEATTEANTEATTEGSTVAEDSASGSTIADTTNGKTETSSTGQEATVQAGDGQSHGDFNKNVKTDPNPVETQFQEGSTPYDESFVAPE